MTCREAIEVKESNYELFHMRQALPKAGQMDSHARPLHEVQTKDVDRQLSNETGNVRQEARAGASVGFHFHHHEKVVGMIPHSIQAHDDNGNQDQKCGMHVHGDATKFAESPEPIHVTSPVFLLRCCPLISLFCFRRRIPAVPDATSPVTSEEMQ